MCTGWTSQHHRNSRAVSRFRGHILQRTHLKRPIASQQCFPYSIQYSDGWAVGTFEIFSSGVFFLNQEDRCSARRWLITSAREFGGTEHLLTSWPSLKTTPCGAVPHWWGCLKIHRCTSRIVHQSLLQNAKTLFSSHLWNINLPPLFWSKLKKIIIIIECTTYDRGNQLLRWVVTIQGNTCKPSGSPVCKLVWRQYSRPSCKGKPNTVLAVTEFIKQN